MSRTKKGSKDPSYEYWSARTGNTWGGSPGAYQKHVTHKIERQKNKRDIVGEEQP